MDEVTELRVSLTVRDLAGAVSLFRDALGLDTVLSWDEPTGAGVVLAAGRATLELVDESPSRGTSTRSNGRRRRADPSASRSRFPTPRSPAGGWRPTRTSASPSTLPGATGTSGSERRTGSS